MNLSLKITGNACHSHQIREEIRRLTDVSFQASVSF